MEIYRDDGDSQLLDEADDGWLPFAVAHGQGAVELRHGPSGEEAERMALLYVLHGLADALHGDFLLFGVIGFEGVDGYEVFAHGLDVVEHQIDHDLEVGPVLSDDVDEQDSVVASEGMVADGDEGAIVEVGEHLEIVDPELEFELILDQAVGEFHSRGVAIRPVDAVDFVEAEEVHHAVDELWVSVEERRHLPDVVIVDHVWANSRACVFGGCAVHIKRGKLSQNLVGRSANGFNPTKLQKKAETEKSAEPLSEVSALFIGGGDLLEFRINSQIIVYSLRQEKPL